MVPCRRTASPSAPSVAAAPTIPSWHSIMRSAVCAGVSSAFRSTGTMGRSKLVEPLRIRLEDLLLRGGRKIVAVGHDLHGVRERAVPVVVVGRIDDDVLAEPLHDPRGVGLARIHADEAAPREEVLGGLAVDARRLLGRELPVLVEPLEPERKP